MAVIDQQCLNAEQPPPFEALSVLVQAEALRALLPEVSNPDDCDSARAGTLLGTVHGERVEIRAVRWFAASSFSSWPARFTDEFCTDLASLREEATREGLELIGWHCMRTTPGTGLSGDEIEFHRRHFPRTTDLAVRLDKAQRDGYRIELYARSAIGAFSQAEHRSGSFYLAADPARISEALEISVQAPAHGVHAVDEFYLRAYEITRTLDERDLRDRWKSWIGDLCKYEWWKKRRSRRSAVPSSGSTLLTELGISSGLAAVPSKPCSAETPVDPPKPVEATATPGQSTEAQNQHIPPAAAASAEAVDEPIRLVAGARRGLRDRWRGWRSVLLPATLTLLLAAAGALIAMWQPQSVTSQKAGERKTTAWPAKTPTEAALGFEPLQTNSGWELHWNASLPAIKTAQNGVLLIRDGKRVKRLELDRSELSNGQVLYVAETQNVDFRLQIYTMSGDLLSESVRVLPNASGIATSPASARSTVAVSNRHLSGTAPEKMARTPGSMHVSASPSLAGFVPPQPLEKHMPKMPSFSTTRDGAGEIAVKVDIDATGHVTNASVASGDSAGGSSVLNRAALSAARTWTFEPARSQGRAVPSNFLILFRFTPRMP